MAVDGHREERPQVGGLSGRLHKTVHLFRDGGDALSVGVTARRKDSAMTTSRAVQQMAANILAILAYHQLPLVQVLTTQSDRLTATVPETFSEALRRADFTAWPFFKNHGTTAIRSWRECCPRYSLQAVEHNTGVWEFDVDIVNPHPGEGLAFTVGHFFEVLANKLRRKKTDPFRVRRGLLARGIQVPEVAAQ